MLVNLGKNKIVDKVLAIMIIISLTFANILMLGMNAIAYATETLENQDTKVKKTELEFDAYFKTDNNQNTKMAMFNVLENNNILNIDINVDKAGYIKQGEISFLNEQGQSDVNFDISQIIDANSIVSEVNEEIKLITLSKINSDTKNSLEIKLNLNLKDKMNINFLSKQSKVVFKGIYVNEDEKEIEFLKEINIHVIWDALQDMKISSEVSKYVNYEIKGKAQTILNTKYVIEQENKNENGKFNTLPVKNTTLTVKVPELNGLKPKYVNVVSTSTKLTNGKTLSDVELNWEYNQENSEVIIKTENKQDINNNIWTGVGQDIYELICVYEGQVNELASVQLEANANIELYKAETQNNKIELKTNNQIELKEQIGNIVTYNVEAKQNSLSKGNIYANYQTTGEQYETEYNLTWRAFVGYAEILDGIKLESKEDKFITTEEELSALDITRYKKTTVNKNNFIKILGNEGKITIKSGATEIATIDVNTATDEEGNFVIDYEKLGINANNIVIVTTKPITEGILEINHLKTITANTINIYNMDIAKQFKLLNLDMALGTKLLGEVEFTNSEQDKDTNIILEETKTKVTLDMNNTILSSLVKNENVEFNIKLNNSEVNSDLYKNPVFDIELPEYIEDVEIKDSHIILDNELKIKSVEKLNVDGKIVIRIILEGAQTKFNEASLASGTNIVINTNIKVKLLAPSKQDLVKLYYTNENAISYENENSQRGLYELKVTYASPTGIVNVTSISNYNNDETIISVNQGEKLGKLEIFSTAKTATMKMMIANNYEETCNEITVLGRIPFKGNKDIKTGEDLGTTVNTTLKTPITLLGEPIEGLAIYYSENGEASRDLNDVKNGWTTSTENLNNIKSFLIVLDNYELPKEKVIEFAYDFEIPENLQHNHNIFGTFETSYTVLKEEGKIKETTIPDKVGLTTGKGPAVEFTLNSTVENNATVFEGQILKYTATITNIGEEILENAIVKTNIPEGATYTRYIEGEGEVAKGRYVNDATIKELTWNLGNFNPEETKIVEYEVEVDALTVESLTLRANAVLTANKLEKQLEANVFQNPVEKAYILVDLETSAGKEEILAIEDEITYNIKIKNTHTDALNNVVITNSLPKGLKYKKAYIVSYNAQTDEYSQLTDNVTYDEATRLVTWNLEKLELDETRQIKLIAEVSEFNENEYDKKVLNKVKVKATGVREVVSNEVENTIARPKLTINQTTTQENKFVKAGESFEYHVTIKNEGIQTATRLTVLDDIPEGLTLTGVSYGINGNMKSSSAGTTGDVEINTTLEAGETLNAVIKVKANTNTKEDTTVTNIVTAQAKNTLGVTSNQIVHIIEKNSNPINNSTSNDNNGNNQNDTDNTDTTPKYKIIGVVWVDENINGLREETEKKVSDVTVKLIRNRDNNIVQQVITDSNGNYAFENVEASKYFIVFEYNTTMYGVAEYKKGGVSDAINSDAIETKISQNGTIKLGAVTDTIDIVDTSISNIDLGLTHIPRFDLKLDKRVDKITLQKPTGNETYAYDQGKMTKVEIAPKVVSSTTTLIEYKIAITNEGTVPGYAKKILDDMPESMQFSSELNAEWYLGNDGNLYNTSLANTIINPGETKELTLILSKKMTQNNVGRVNNIAEIVETYNDLGLPDIDSTENNKVQTEDDMSNADTLISLRTGSPVTYTGITLAILTVLGGGIYIIKKKVLGKV